MSIEALRGSAGVRRSDPSRAPQRGQVASAAISGRSSRFQDHGITPRLRTRAGFLRAALHAAGARGGRNAAAHVREVLEIEINSATDNPLVFASGSRALAS